MANLLIALVVVFSLIWQVSPTPLQHDCKKSTSGGCFWIEYLKSGMTFSDGKRKCALHGSVQAVIPDRMSYDMVVKIAREILRENDDGKRLTKGFWTGMTYNPSNKTMNPEGAFNGNWYVHFPSTKPDLTRVLVTVRLDTSSYQGLRNVKPSETRKQSGVICWKPTVKCQVTYDGKCFWVVDRTSDTITFEQGSQICSDKGGKVGNIYAKSQYDQIIEIMRKIASSHYGSFLSWIGLKYNKSTNRATLSDGSPAQYVIWMPGYPNPSRCCDMTMLAIPKPHSIYLSENMNNYSPSHSQGVLCEK